MLHTTKFYDVVGSHPPWVLTNWGRSYLIASDWRQTDSYLNSSNFVWLGEKGHIAKANTFTLYDDHPLFLVVGIKHNNYFHPFFQLILPFFQNVINQSNQSMFIGSSLPNLAKTRHVLGCQPFLMKWFLCRLAKKASLWFCHPQKAEEFVPPISLVIAKVSHYNKLSRAWKN